MYPREGSINGIHLPIIAITVYDEHERCLKNGRDGHVSKPINVRDLERHTYPLKEKASNHITIGYSKERVRLQTWHFASNVLLERVIRQGVMWGSIGLKRSSNA